MFAFCFLAPKGKTSNNGAIIGGVIGGILLLIIVGVAVFFFLRWKSRYSFILYFSKKIAWKSKTKFSTQFCRVFLRN